MLARIRTLVVVLVFLALFAAGGLVLYGHARRHPEDLPWTPLDLSQPIGLFTGRKLADLAGERQRCQRLLREAGIRFTALPPLNTSPQCGHDGAVRFDAGGARAIRFQPADLGTSCAVAAGLALWEWHVVQPAAERHFGAAVVRIDHWGSYQCRRVGGGETGRWSEHARANALDVVGFTLADGRRVSVVNDWADPGPKANFLREVRDGACRLFATVLSPDYNWAHRDHFHLDQARRGAFGWRVCR